MRAASMRNVLSSWPGVARVLALVVLVSGLTYVASPRAGTARADTLSLGTVTVSTATANHCQNSGTCYQFTVTCPDVRNAITGYLQAQEPAGSPRGLVMFFSGGGGAAWWANNPGALGMLSALNANGYETVQVDFGSSWLASAQGEQAGAADLACRPASLVQWVHSNLYGALRVPSLPVGLCGFCVTGNSGGSAAAAYAISRYGLSSIVNAAILTSGPPLASMDKGCNQDPADSAYSYSAWARSLIDGTYGYSSNGPCASNDASWVQRWQADSVNYGGEYDLPSTRVLFIFGGDDTSEAVPHGKDYLNLLLSSGSPMVNEVTVPGMPHEITDSSAALAALSAAVTTTSFSPSPTVTPSDTATQTLTSTPDATPSLTPTLLPTDTPSPVSSPTSGTTATPVPSPTGSDDTATATPTSTAAPSPSPTPMKQSPLRLKVRVMHAAVKPGTKQQVRVWTLARARVTIYVTYPRHGGTFKSTFSADSKGYWKRTWPVRTHRSGKATVTITVVYGKTSRHFHRYFAVK